MLKQKRITLRLNDELYNLVKNKCRWLGIGITPLIKVFLRSFVTQKGVGFYVGDEDLCDLFARWLSKKAMDKVGKPHGVAPGRSPKLKDLYQLSNPKHPKFRATIF